MATPKKNMYEMLGLAPSASQDDIERAYAALRDAPPAPGANADDVRNRQKILEVAYRTLSSPMSRQAYDAFLHTKGAPSVPSTPQRAVLAAPALAQDSSAAAPSAQALALRADALSIKAEAMALKADALMLRADVSNARAADISTPLGSAGAATRIVLRAVGAVLLGWFLYSVWHGMRASPATAAKVVEQSDDKAALQEYYQAHGVMPANRAEMAQLEAARRKQETERYALEREKLRQEAEKRQFEEDVRRSTAQAERNLEEGERRAREAAREEEERERQARMEAAQREREERERQDRERDRWRRVLQTPSGY